MNCPFIKIAREATLHYITSGHNILMLFLIYINDVPRVSNKVFSLMFADDSNIFIEGNAILKIQNELNTEMMKISSWLKANKLSLNINKTHYMLFKGRRAIKDEISIKIDQTQIKQTQCTQFLGVQIDDKITWKNHIIYTSKKVARVADGHLTTIYSLWCFLVFLPHF